MTDAIMPRRDGETDWHGTGIDISKAEVTLDFTSVIFDGNIHKPKVTSVMFADKPLVEKQDYVCISEEKKDVGNYTIQVVGILNYDGVYEASWSIKQATGSIQLSNDSVTIKGIMGTINQTITITKPELCNIAAEGDEFVNAEIINENRLKLTSLKAGRGQVTIKVNDKNFTSAEQIVTVNVERATGSISIYPTKVTLNGKESSTTATLTITGDGEINIGTSDYVDISRNDKILTITSKAAGSGSVLITLAESENYTSSSCSLNVEVIIAAGAIYGVKWTGNSSPALTRTDAAAFFFDPNPAISNEDGSSPFDELMPWAGMKIVEKDGNSLVAIPKFWYKITNNGGTGLTVQIANYAAEGFKVSPAHMDRNDGIGERDWVYVGRYHCADDYKSKTGVKPTSYETRAEFRTGITGLGDGYYMWDFAMWRTIQMLYTVEFAHWDSQLKIGFGCGNSGSTEAMGSTDSMTYHTGTKSSSRETYAVGTQYRYIEGLWDNVYDWLDGITYSSNNVYVGIEPSKYNDSTTNYTNVGKAASNGYISAWGIPTQSEYEWAIYPKTCSGGETTYVCDYFGSGSPCCYVGGYYYNQYRYCGLFCSGSVGTSYSDSYVGARIQYLPQSAHEELV